MQEEFLCPASVSPLSRWASSRAAPPPITRRRGGGAGTAGSQMNVAGATSSGGSSGSSGGTGTTGTVQGTAMLTGGPFTVQSGYQSVSPLDGGGVFSDVVVVLFADPLTCSEALTRSAGHSQVRLTLNGPNLTVGGPYSVGLDTLGQSAAIEVGVEYPDAGSTVYTAGQGSSMSFSELDSTTVAASFVLYDTLADGGSLSISGQDISVPYCAGLQ